MFYSCECTLGGRNPFWIRSIPWEIGLFFNRRSGAAPIWYQRPKSDHRGDSHFSRIPSLIIHPPLTSLFQTSSPPSRTKRLNTLAYSITTIILIAQPKNPFQLSFPTLHSIPFPFHLIHLVTIKAQSHC